MEQHQHHDSHAVYYLHPAAAARPGVACSHHSQRMGLGTLQDGSHASNDAVAVVVIAYANTQEGIIDGLTMQLVMHADPALSDTVELNVLSR